jgi:hypothetical protein
MTEERAKQEGLHFTGMYSRNKEVTKAEIDDARKRYPKARIVLVRTPDSKLSRGYTPGACGWSAYADDVYSAYQTVETSTKTIGNYQSRYDYFKKQFDEQVQKLDEELEAAKVKLAKANEILGLDEVKNFKLAV